MQTYSANIVVTIPYTPIKAIDFEQAEALIVELFEEEYPDLNVFDYKISDLKSVKEIKIER